MKIVHAVYSMEMGGAEMLVAQLCRMQRQRGHEVSIVAYSKLGVLGETLRAEGIEVRVLGEAHPARTMLRHLRLFRKLRPDVVHTHNPAPTLQAAPGARLSGARCVIATRHSLVERPYDLAAERKFNLFARFFLDWIAGICEITCTNLRGIPGARTKKIVRVYNGVSQVAPLHEHLNETDAVDVERSFSLLFVGRLAEIKDLPTMLRAVMLARKRVAGLRLSIVGDGPVRSELERLSAELDLSDCVTFFGQQMETARFFHAADLFMMSSVSEGLPMSLLQAMSLGLPAVLTDVGGMHEVLELSNGGLLTPVGDAEAMANAIVRLAQNESLRTEFGARAAAAFQRYFTLEQMEAEYFRLYRIARSRR